MNLIQNWIQDTSLFNPHINMLKLQMNLIQNWIQDIKYYAYTFHKTYKKYVLSEIYT